MTKQEFTIGRRYRTRRGWYEVISVTRSTMAIRYDDGSEVLDMPLVLAARMHSNIEREDARFFPNDTPAIRSDIAWTLGALARNADLQAEVPPQSMMGFLEHYAESTGIRLANSTPGLSPISRGGANKWGSELRIYFPIALTTKPRFALPVGVDVVSSPNPNQGRVNNNSFWWCLVRSLGFRCGKHQDEAAIQAHLPNEYWQDFRDGYDVVIR